MKRSITVNLFTFFTLYIAQSIPMSFFSTALPVLMRQGNYSLFAIALLKLIKLPWILKFLWSPLVDSRTESIRDYKRWIFGAEIVYALIIFGVAMLNIETNSTLIFLLILLAFVSSATQDIAQMPWLPALSNAKTAACSTACNRWAHLPEVWWAVVFYCCFFTVSDGPSCCPG
jgi:hypothetical protein